MNKEKFMREIERALDNISEAERADILYDYEEHFMIGKENGKTEEEICLELGDPRDIINNYLLNNTNPSIQEDTSGNIKENIEKSNLLVSGYNRRKVILASGAIIMASLLFVAGLAEITRHRNSNTFVNNNKVDIDGINIDRSGIHGDGISVDGNGIKVSGISVDSNGVKMPGVSVDNNGIKVPGVSIDNNGIKLPGINIDDNGINIDLPNVKINIKN